jgi:hypothetical protein
MINGLMSYTPAAEVGRVVSTPVSSLCAVTVAFATTAPLASVTVPVIAPWPPVCPFAGPAHNPRQIPATNSKNCAALLVEPERVPPSTPNFVTISFSSRFSPGVRWL